MVMTLTAPPTKAFFVATPRPDAAMRLICFPWAGGAPWAYRDWCHALPEVELCTACLPGRGARSAEPPASDMTALLNTYCDHLIPWTNDKPYALFGHSLGGLMSFGLAQALQRHGLQGPEHVFISGYSPDPQHLPRPCEDKADGEAFLNSIQDSHGLPEAVLNHPALRSLAITQLRSDLRLAASYRARSEAVQAPLTVFYGRQDPLTPRPSMQRWRDYSRSSVTLHELPGAHFFLREQAPQLLRDIRQSLRFPPEAAADSPGRKPRCDSSPAKRA